MVTTEKLLRALWTNILYIYITYRDKNIDVCFKMGFISIGLKIFEEWCLKEVI